MPAIADIDALYDGFCAALPTELRRFGRSLAYELKLAPDPSIPWSAVFKNRITLQAPSLLFEGTPGVETVAAERAGLAHMLAVIEAFGTDRIADKQVTATPELLRVLEAARSARDDALTRIGGADAARMAREADQRTRNAIVVERNLLACGAGVDLEVYQTVSADKQSVGVPPSMVLAQAVGFESAKLEMVRTTLMGVWLGLQFQDDVVDWEEDVTLGGAWAVELARHSAPRAPASANPEDLKPLVDSSGVLTTMLGLSAARFQSGLAGAESLGATQLAEWLRVRSAEAIELCERERESPGFVRRMRRLAPWAAEVLA
jgi:hypothetical protein